MTREALLAALQLGDSAFPSGSFAFSWGLEGLVADGLVDGEADLALLVEDLLMNRWRSFDRIVLRRIYRLDDMTLEIHQLVSLDLEIEATSWALPLRVGSKRAGRALLNVHTRLGTPDLRAYCRCVGADPRLGHLAVAQGVVWRASGLALDVAEAVGAWTLASTTISAAIRLGVVGHVGAQAVLTRVRAVAAKILCEVPDPNEPLHAFTPLVDIALMRHEHRDLRLFST
jgi:urease accessory protein